MTRRLAALAARAVRRRRAAALSLAGGATLLAGGASLLPVPYVVLEPGPTADTLGRSGEGDVIRVEGRSAYPTEGALSLTTVGVLGNPERGLALLPAVWAWLDRQSAVVPQEQVFPTGTTNQQVQQRNAEDMQISQQEATTAAMRQLDVPVVGVLVRSVLEGAPALNKLKAGDELLTVDGRPIRQGQDVRDAVGARRPGDEIVVRLRRDGRELEERIRAGDATGPNGARRTVIGIVPAEKYPFTVRIEEVRDRRGRDIGGPSAGLMFALGVVDKLTPGPLTGGTHVAGTGTIDATGRVGAIGGIQQKLVGARSAGATVFLVPEGNCADAAEAIPDGLRLVKVATLDQAVDALEELRGGGDVPACTR